MLGDVLLLLCMAIGGILNAALSPEDVVVGFRVPERGIRKVVHPGSFTGSQLPASPAREGRIGY